MLVSHVTYSRWYNFRGYEGACAPESNTVASLLVKHIYSILGLKMECEMQVVELFDFVWLHNHSF